MFTVYCPTHRSTVLLFPDNIDSLVNHPGGIALHWRCTCGQTGVEHMNGMSHTSPAVA